MDKKGLKKLVRECLDEASIQDQSALQQSVLKLNKTLARHYEDEGLSDALFNDLENNYGVFLRKYGLEFDDLLYAIEPPKINIELLKKSMALKETEVPAEPAPAPAPVTPPTPYPNYGEPVSLEGKSLSDIAMIISKDWKKVNYAAKPYLEAMYSLNSINDDYGMDSGRSVVAYFLSNASQWKGEVAKKVKDYLKKLLKS